MKTAVLVFPGSNCDRDLAVALHRATGRAPAMVWHKDVDLPAGTDLVAIPGGFSFGDHLRCGAIAAQAPIMASVKNFAAAGGHVLGICNGFQILIESGLLPGTLMRNAGIRFVCRPVGLSVATT
ncbi:MAG: phosphoribosylformylglycinamidine synthase subunit PurQ, partial [Pseudomonadota bacterium]